MFWLWEKLKDCSMALARAFHVNGGYRRGGMVWFGLSRRHMCDRQRHSRGAERRDGNIWDLYLPYTPASSSQQQLASERHNRTNRTPKVFSISFQILLLDISWKGTVCILLGPISNTYGFI